MPALALRRPVVCLAPGQGLCHDLECGSVSCTHHPRFNPSLVLALSALPPPACWKGTPWDSRTTARLNRCVYGDPNVAGRGRLHHGGVLDNGDGLGYLMPCSSSAAEDPLRCRAILVCFLYFAAWPTAHARTAVLAGNSAPHLV